MTRMVSGDSWPQFLSSAPHAGEVHAPIRPMGDGLGGSFQRDYRSARGRLRVTRGPHQNPNRCERKRMKTHQRHTISRLCGFGPGDLTASIIPCAKRFVHIAISHRTHGIDQNENKGMATACKLCGDARWVCEDHPDRAWGGASVSEDACNCWAAGMACPS